MSPWSRRPARRVSFGLRTRRERRFGALYETRSRPAFKRQQATRYPLEMLVGSQRRAVLPGNGSTHVFSCMRCPGWLPLATTSRRFNAFVHRYNDGLYRCDG